MSAVDPVVSGCDSIRWRSPVMARKELRSPLSINNLSINNINKLMLASGLDRQLP
jgi:hypothetical protein